MEKKKKVDRDPLIGAPEKHPLEAPPDGQEEPVVSEEDLDKIPDEETEETPAYEPPEPGEGP